MRSRRRRGTGGIERTRDGRFRVRGPGRSRPSLGVYDTEIEAERVLAAALHELADVTHDGATLQQWAEAVLDQRERDGLRGVREERNRWATYVAGDPIAKLPIRTLDRRDVMRWLDGVRARRATRPGPDGRVATSRKLTRRTVQNALTLMRAVLEDAVARSVIAVSPARDVTLPRDVGRTHEPWTYLTIEEQRALIAAAGDDWPLIAFAIGCGLRQGEQWALRIEDVHVTGDRPHVVVRYGSRGRPTKSGRVRTVPLFGYALAAARAQLEILSRRKRSRTPRSGDGLFFPSRHGEHRSKGEPKSFARALEASKIARKVRWHDLRHTCASSLVAGWWGRAWSLEEVRALLGHSSVQVTERYAHLAGTIVDDAAAVMRGDRSARETTAETAKYLSHLRDLNSRPTVYETGSPTRKIEGLDRRTALSRGYAALVAAEAGETTAGRLLVESVVELLELVEAHEDQARRGSRKLRTA